MRGSANAAPGAAAAAGASTAASRRRRRSRATISKRRAGRCTTRPSSPSARRSRARSAASDGHASEQRVAFRVVADQEGHKVLRGRGAQVLRQRKSCRCAASETRLMHDDGARQRALPRGPATVVASAGRTRSTISRRPPHGAVGDSENSAARQCDGDERASTSFDAVAPPGHQCRALGHAPYGVERPTASSAARGCRGGARRRRRRGHSAMRGLATPHLARRQRERSRR